MIVAHFEENLTRPCSLLSLPLRTTCRLFPFEPYSSSRPSDISTCHQTLLFVSFSVSTRTSCFFLAPRHTKLDQRPKPRHPCPANRPATIFSDTTYKSHTIHELQESFNKHSRAAIVRGATVFHKCRNSERRSVATVRVWSRRLLLMHEHKWRDTTAELAERERCLRQLR